MDRYHYLAVLGLCVLVTLPLEFVLRARVYRRPRRLLAALAPMFVLFVLWDLYGVVRGHWTYNPRFVTGWHVGVFPVEELLFFVVVPLCALLSFEGVRTVLRWLGRPDDPPGGADAPGEPEPARRQGSVPGVRRAGS